MPGLTAYSKNISCLAETMKHETWNIMNEICHHTNSEGSSQICVKIAVQKSFLLSWDCALFLAFWRQERNQYELCGRQIPPMLTNFSCNNGKGSALSNSLCHSFDDKTTRNQWRSTDKLAPIRNVFESIISRFQMAYTPNEHIITDKQLVVFRGKYIQIYICNYILARVVE